MSKKLTIKALSILLMLSMLCLALAGCFGSSDTPAETSKNAETTNANSDPSNDDQQKAEEEPVEGGIDLREYCIVRSKDAPSDVRNAANVLKTFLSVYCGVDINVKTDDKPATEKEILFGMTNRQESSQAAQKVGSADWSIELLGEKIVLSAGVNSDIVYTSNYLVENCLRKNSRYIVLGQTPINSSDVSSNTALKLSMDGNELKYVKVALLANSSGAYLDNVGFAEAALLLADNIRNMTSATPSVSAYVPDASYFQILVASAKNGKTYLPAGVTVGDKQFAVCRKGNNIVIIANDAMGAEMGTQTIIDAIKKADKESLELNAMCKGVATSYTYGSNLDLEKDAEYRIMSYNLERVELNNVDRSELHMNNILFYNPDIVGFQEFCTDLKNTLGLKIQRNGYTLVEPIPEKYNDADDSCASRYSMYNNYTAIAYKTNKFTLLESGAKRIIPSKTSGNSIQGSYGWPGYTCTWAVLKDKTTGEVFAVTSLHNKTGGAAADAEKKIVSLGIVKGIVDKLVKNYNCPVFMVGDYNSNEKMADYKSFVKVDNKIFDSRYVAERGYSIGHSHDTSGTVVCSGTTANAIDHIFVTGNARVLRHRYAHSISVAKASDHKPVFIDVIVGEPQLEIDTTAVFTGFGSMKINKGLTASAIKPENIALKKMSE